MTNAQRRAAALRASRNAEVDSLRSDATPQPTPSSAFCPHEAGAYYLADVGTVGTFKMFARDLRPPVYTYGITTIRFELDPDTGKWVWFDGEKNQSPRKTQDGWRLGSRTLHDTREGAEAELQRAMVKNGDRVTKVHDLPDFVYFDHSIHVAKGVGCTTCHGRVDKMPLMLQENSLQMEWCLECHRNPAKYLRPRSEIYTMGYQPAEPQAVIGARLMKEYHVNPRTSCSTCHR